MAAEPISAAWNSALVADVSPASTVHKYDVLRTKAYMTMAEAHQLSVALAQRLVDSPWKPECVVGIANGALFTARVIADELDVPLHVVLVRRAGSRFKQRAGMVMRRLRVPSRWLTAGPLLPLWRLFHRETAHLHVDAADFQFDLRGKRVVLVDDCVETGSSMRTAMERLRAAGALDVRTAALCWYRGIGDSGAWQPDYHLHSFTHFYPWSESSIHYREFVAWLAMRGLRLRK